MVYALMDLKEETKIGHMTAVWFRPGAAESVLECSRTWCYFLGGMEGGRLG